MSVPSMVHRSGDTLIVRSVVSGDTLFGSGDSLEDADYGDELNEITDDKDLPECKIKRNYSCSRCDYFTQNPRHFLYHLRDVHKEKVRIYECPNCLYASKHFQKLLRHTKMVHGSTEGVDMPEYARSKGKKRSLPPEEEDEEEQQTDEQHVDSDECEIELEAASVFKCSLCTFTARNQAQLAKHEREEHIKTKFFRCSKCTYVTHMKARFTKHVKYHSMPMIKCDLCDFRTPYKWNLDRHCKNHNGRGTFRCSACNFTADIKQSLTVHEMNHHVPPVGQAAGLGVGRRRNKVGASDSTAAEEAAQVAAVAAAAAAARIEPEPSAPADDDDDNDRKASEKQLKIPAKKSSKTGSSNSEHNNCAYGPDFIHPDDIIHHANGNIYIKNKCKLCNFKSAWDGEMAKHEEKVHNILRPNAKPTKKPTRPVPNLIPIPSQTSVLKITQRAAAAPPTTKMSSSTNNEPIMSQKDINEICAKSGNSSLKDFASLFNSEDVFKTHPPSEQHHQKIPDLLPTSAYQSQKHKTTTTTELLKQKNASFFDKLKAKLTSTGGNLTCQHCGHESKCLTESTAHQKTCGKERTATPVFAAPVHSISSTRCQYCRQRCKSSIDLLNHLQTCPEAVKTLSERTAQVEIFAEEEQQESEPHPMENRVFVWNNIEVPMDIEIDESPYEYVEEKQEDNLSLDLSVRTQSPCSENSYVGPEVTTHSAASVTEKIPTHGNDISVAQHKRVFKCPHCSFWASTASRFHVHIVGHLNKKPFECSLCSYRSNWRWDITKHIKLKSVRDPAHETAKVLMTDETGRRNYTKYNKYLTEINVGGDHHNETSGGSGTRPKIHDSPSQVLPSSKTELPKLTRAPNSSDFSPLLKNSLRPPPALKAADDSLFAKVTTSSEKKRPAADNKKTLWQCKKCNFRDASRDKLLVHVKGHYLQQGGAPAVSGGDHQGELSGNPELDERHCRLKHHGDIRVVVGTKNGPEKVELDEQVDEPDHVDLPQMGTFKCKQCPFSNNDNEEFEQHLEGHTQRTNSVTKCHLCNFYVPHQDELHGHLKLHGIIEPEDYLAKREKNHQGDAVLEVTKRYKCTTCPYVTNSKSQYSYHKQFHKPRGGQYTCPTCGYNVSKRHLLHQHLKVHGINAASQKQNGDVIDLDEISDEIEEVTPGNTCLESQSFPDIPLVWVSKNGKFSKMYKCRFCPHVNLRKVNIQEHEKMHGVREKNPNASRLSEIEHRCPDCNYVCNNAGVLSSHSKVHQGLYGRIHCLVDPSKTDEEQVKELTHFLSLHASPSADAVNLEDDEQMDADYSDEQAEGGGGGETTLYFCDKCPARFLKENEFSIHLRFHGVRLFYKCEYCTYTARQKPHLLAHNNVHSDDYQERTKTLKTLYTIHPAHAQPAVYVSANQNGEAIWVADETKSYADVESEPPEAAATNKTVGSSRASVPLSGTDLFLQRNEANQKQLNDSSASQTRGGNPDFIYPTCLKNGRMKEKRYKCLKCPSAFEKREQYKVHLGLHGSKQKYMCEFCDYSVKYYANYAQHIKKHQMNAHAQVARNTTDEPEDEEEEETKQEHHQTAVPRETAADDKKQSFWCPSCPYTNHRKDAVDNHQKRHVSVSGTSSNYTCEHCDYSVPQVHFLREHVKWHFAHNKSLQPEAYMICDKMKLTSTTKKVEDAAADCVKEDDVEVKMEDDDDGGPESLIFEDRGDDVEENRFEPPLHGDVVAQQHSADSEGDKLFVNPETGEVVNKDYKTSAALQASSTTDSSDVSMEEENVDSQVASDNIN